MRRVALILSLAGLFSVGVSWAKLAASNKAGVSMGHLHYHVRDLAANRKFWTDLGARPLNVLGTTEVLQLPGVLILLTRAESSGGTEGSVLNHVGFRVPDIHQYEARMKAAGYKIQPTTTGTGKVTNVFTPEGERIELLEDLSVNLEFTLDAAPGRRTTQQPMVVPIALHHVHLYVPEGSLAAIKTWYVKWFGAVPGKRYHYEAADLPGVNLNFSEVPDRLAATQGRMLDHIGFEVRDLEAFCEKLEAGGVTLDVPYTRLAIGGAKAVLTDPWGTSIELTEGSAGLRWAWCPVPPALQIISAVRASADSVGASTSCNRRCHLLAVECLRPARYCGLIPLLALSSRQLAVTHPAADAQRVPVILHRASNILPSINAIPRRA